MVERLGVIWFQFSAIQSKETLLNQTFRQLAAVFFSPLKKTAADCQTMLHTDLVLVFDIKSSTFDEVFHHLQVSIHGCPVECCLLCIIEMKHVNFHDRSKVLGNANMATISRQVKSIESILWMYVQHKQSTVHTHIRRSRIKHNQ